MPQITDLSFPELFDRIRVDFKMNSERVATERWQSWNVEGRQDYETRELVNYSFTVEMESMDLDFYRKQIEPNLPWADNHFLERVGGQPINPGVEWANWPWGVAAAKHRNASEQFNHNYMERYWPKHAGQTPDGTIYHADGSMMPTAPVIRGIRHEYGDLRDLVNYLVKEPHTRQAWLPIFFPEDTGFGDGGRKPCTLGYQFLLRDNKLHIFYPLRSCDHHRHFRDDIYMTIRLGLWIIEQCQLLDPKWDDVTLGCYTMHMTSFHIFYNDYIKMFGKGSF